MGQSQGNPRQPKAEQGKPRARHTVPVSCFALLGESLLSINKIKNILSSREKERGQDQAGAGAGARQAKASHGRARQAKASRGRAGQANARPMQAKA